jgi:hypothetical protein
MDVAQDGQRLAAGIAAGIPTERRAATEHR